MKQDPRRRGRSSPERRKKVSPGGGTRALFHDLCDHLRHRFPGRFPEAEVQEIVAHALETSRQVPVPDPRDASRLDSYRSTLVAKINRDALDRLAADHESLWRAANGHHIDDDDFVSATFGGPVDAAAVVEALRIWTRQGRAEDCRIVAQYLDMAYLNGAPPTYREVAERLAASHRSRSCPTERDVRSTMARFLELLEQDAMSRRAT